MQGAGCGWRACVWHCASLAPIYADHAPTGSQLLVHPSPGRADAAWFEQITEYSTSKTGKHGHAKAKMVALDIFTGKRLEDANPTSHNMQAPVGACVRCVGFHTWVLLTLDS